MKPALPPKPRKPDLDECCGSGCDPCVFDRYHDALDAWKRACREIEANAKAAPGEATMRAAPGEATARAAPGEATVRAASAGILRDPATARDA